MNEPPCILVVDDNPNNVDILKTRLESHGYRVVTAEDGEGAIARTRVERPDLVLLDIMMPGIDGLEACRRLKSDPALPFTPIVIVTAKSEAKDVIAGLEAGADEYLTKPVDHGALVARVASMLRIKALQETVERQRAEIAAWNAQLQRKVDEQVAQLDGLGRLKGFFSPQLAEAIVSGGADDLLKPHRREVTVVYLDLRGFTPFTESVEPEEVMSVLAQYHTLVGEHITAHQGTIEHFAGDGIMILFNDPVPVPDAPREAASMTVDLRDRFAALRAGWQRRGYDLDLGAGIAVGYATLGTVGFEGRRDYAVVGNVANLVARLCARAKGGQILIDRRTRACIEDKFATEEIGTLELKGFARPVPVFNVTGLR
ncbi:MAG: response regulator [Betaproteobacteria bacterium]|jgi:class 3 adenylate cyclase